MCRNVDSIENRSSDHLPMIGCTGVRRGGGQRSTYPLATHEEGG